MNKENIKIEEVNFVKSNALKIIPIIGVKCRACGDRMEHIHHVSYKNLPHDNIKEYCKYLVPLCAKHHAKEHSNILKMYKYPIIHKKNDIRIGDLNRIVQRSIGFHKRQHDFFYFYPEFKPDVFCRKAIDVQIAIIDPDYLETSNKILKLEDE